MKSTPPPPYSAGALAPRKPAAPSLRQLSRSLIPARFHPSIFGTISVSTKRRTCARNISCSSVKMSRRIRVWPRGKSLHGRPGVPNGASILIRTASGRRRRGFVREEAGALHKIKLLPAFRRIEMIKLYGTSKSRSARSLWALEELGLKYEHVPVETTKAKSPEHLKLNPNGHVPVLEDDGKIFWESMAINLYLAAKYGKAPLWPESHEGRGHAVQWSFWGMTEAEPHLLTVLRNR